MIRNAKYHGIPCTFNDETNGLYGKNWFWDKLVSINIWLDIEFFMVDSLQILVDFSNKDDLDKFKNKNNL